MHVIHISGLMTKPTKWPCVQRRLRSAWASVQSDQSLLLCAQWVANDPSFLHADSEDSDQTGRMPRLIRVYAGCACHFVGFVTRRFIWKSGVEVSFAKNHGWFWYIWPDHSDMYRWQSNEMITARTGENETRRVTRGETDQLYAQHGLNRTIVELNVADIKSRDCTRGELKWTHWFAISFDTAFCRFWYR